MCIAEKPSVAKEIAHVLGAKNRHNGYFEGNGYSVTWTFGHLCTLKEPRDYHEQLRYWNIDNLPILPTNFGIKLIKNSGVKEQFEVIKKLCTEAEEVINCGDAGQEGELIQRWVLNHAGNKKPVKRLWISSLTEEAIREGFQNLKDEKDYTKLYYAGTSRAIGDWLLGINATRLYTLKYAPKGTVLSIGRVQTPTLALIVNRHAEIENFVSKDYWELKTKYRDVIFSSTLGKIDNEEKVTEIIQQLENSTFEILDYEKKKGKESAPKLFDLTSLQVEANKKFNLSADETLKIAQSLYEKKFLSYPRVDTRYLPDDIYPKVPGILQSMNAYSDLAAPLLQEKIRKSKNVFDNKKVTDHHAIIPTNVTANGLYGSEEKVYDLVAKRFLANFYPDCIISKTTVKGKAVETNFKTTGKQILEPGWRVIYGKEKIEDDSKDSKKEETPTQLLPEFTVGENGPHKAFSEKKQTKPPKLFTEATLLRAMETAGKQVDDEEMRELMKENGIGRPSTRANIIETLFKRKYISKQRKSIIPTITGQQLIGTIKHDIIKSPELTGNWEKKIRDIELGTYDVKLFMKEMNAFVREVVTHVKMDQNSIKIEQADTTKSKKKTTSKKEAVCPKCEKGSIMEGKTAFGCSQFKEGCDFRVPIIIASKKLTLTHINQLIQKGKTNVIKGFEISGKKKNGQLILTSDFNVELEEQKEVKLACPVCEKGEILKGKTAYGCSSFKEGCTFKIPFVVYEKKLTKTQVDALLKKKTTNLIKGFKINGEKVNAKIVLNDDNQLKFKRE